MPAGSRYFEYPLGAFLALDLRKVGIDGAVVGDQRVRRGQGLLAAQVIDQGEQRGRRDNSRSVGVVGLEPAPGRLSATHCGTDQAAPGGCRGDRRRQHPWHTAERAVQRQFAQHHEVLQALAGEHAHGREQRQRDRQVVVAAFLGEVGR